MNKLGKKLLAVFCAALILAMPLTTVYADTIQDEEGNSYESSMIDEPVSSETSNEDESSVDDDESGLDNGSGLDENTSSLPEDEEEIPEDDESNFMVMAAVAAPWTIRVGSHFKYMSGSGTKFNPNGEMTRAEFATVIYNILESKPEAKSGVFSDVADGKWYSNAVNALGNVKIMVGSGGKFRPEDSITRAEVITTFSHFFELEGTTSTYKDVKSTHWGYKYIVNAEAKGWIKGYNDGTFKPNNNIIRAEVTAVANGVMGRVDENFAALANKYKNGELPFFTDVSANYWGFNHIAEAAEPVTKPADPEPKPEPEEKIFKVTASGGLNLRSTPSSTGRVLVLIPSGANVAVTDTTTYSGWYGTTYVAHTGFAASAYLEEVKETETPSTGYYKVTADNGLNLRSGAGTSYSVLTVIPYNAVVSVTDTKTYPGWYKLTYGDKTGYASSDYLVPTSDPGVGNSDGVISATTANVPLYKSIYLTASVNGSYSGLTWSSDNTDVAVIVSTKVPHSGKCFIYGKAQGTANIIVKNSAGQKVASCKVTVGTPEAVRFAIADKRTPSAGESFNLLAVTDTSKTAIKFVVTGPSNTEYTTTTYSTETKQSSISSALPVNSARVFRQSVSFSKAGTYTIKAYSKDSSGNWSSFYVGSTFLVGSSGDVSATTSETRVTSSKMLDIIAQFEGKASDVYFDTAANYVPTVGFGYVIDLNGTFYNNLTDTEIKAMLYTTVTNDGYEKAVENFRSKNGILINQYQFDALVSFVYNLGTGVLTSSYDTIKIMLNATSKNSGTGTVSIGGSKVYSSTSATSVVDTLSSGTTVTVSETSRINNSGVNSVWYKISYGSKTGWIRAGNVAMSSPGTIDLAYVDEQSFGSNLLLWHNAGGVALPGLATRRLAEAKVFCYGSYDEAYHSCSTYTKNVGFTIPSNFNYSESNGRGIWTVK